MCELLYTATSDYPNFLGRGEGGTASVPHWKKGNISLNEIPTYRYIYFTRTKTVKGESGFQDFLLHSSTKIYHER